MTQIRREPTWSGALTRPLTGRIPVRWRRAVIVAVKAFHTAAFFSIASLIGLFTWDGIRGRSTRRTGIAATVAIAETAVYASNNQVCPLTPLVEELGAASGSVTDIFLPDAISRRIPIVSGAVLVLGLVLQARRWRGRRNRRGLPRGEASGAARRAQDQWRLPDPRAALARPAAAALLALA